MSATFEFTHACGFQTHHANAYAMHAKHCDGGGTARSGRIDARNGRPRLPVADPKTERRREQYRAAKRSRPSVALTAVAVLPTIQAAATDKAMEIVLAGLRARRDAIDAAIAALEAI